MERNGRFIVHTPAQIQKRKREGSMNGYAKDEVVELVNSLSEENQIKFFRFLAELSSEDNSALLPAFPEKDDR